LVKQFAHGGAGNADHIEVDIEMPYLPRRTALEIDSRRNEVDDPCAERIVPIVGGQDQVGTVAVVTVQPPVRLAKTREIPGVMRRSDTDRIGVEEANMPATIY